LARDTGEASQPRRAEECWTWIWRGSLTVALALHGWILFGHSELRGGADLLPHLRLIQQMAEAPELRSVYAPAYHAIGALLSPLVGLALFPKFFAFAAAAAYLLGFRFFQRGAGLPTACAALFAFAPYTLALSRCIPKTEVAGYALAFVALGMLARRRYVATALILALCFWVHTAAAILLGIAGGVWALASRDARGLAALAAGTLGFAPLLVAHVAAGCSPAEALLLSENDYLRATSAWSSAGVWDVILMLASPVALLLAALGAPALWRRHVPAAAVCAVLVVLYLNELWLSPLEMRSALDLLRGLSVLSLPLAVAGGFALEAQRRTGPWLVLAAGLWALLCLPTALPRACHVREVSLAELRGLEVSRCTFRWHGPAIQRPARRAPR
jgi:hypothetical protein